ncbi:MAG: 2-amino-4-hydroxy-6-hydroxymethyldihydropteridine diphosphokinase [Ginsengibacter sp.]
MNEAINEVFLLLGANLGDRNGSLNNAKHSIEQKAGKIITSSSLYETEAWGNINQPAFLNQVIKITSALTAPILLHQLLLIEQEAGRVRTVKNAPRILDIDILFFNDEVYHLPELKIPHPEIQNRNFALQPLNEIAPFFVHPVIGKNISTLLNECRDVLKAEKLEPQLK